MFGPSEVGKEMRDARKAKTRVQNMLREVQQECLVLTTEVGNLRFTLHRQAAAVEEGPEKVVTSHKLKGAVERLATAQVLEDTLRDLIRAQDRAINFLTSAVALTANLKGRQDCAG